MFSQKELARIVKATVPADRRHAVVGTLDDDGAAVVVKMKLKDRWEVEGVWRRDWGGNQDTGIKVIYSWQ